MARPLRLSLANACSPWGEASHRRWKAMVATSRVSRHLADKTCPPMEGYGLGWPYAGSDELTREEPAT